MVGNHITRCIYDFGQCFTSQSPSWNDGVSLLLLFLIVKHVLLTVIILLCLTLLFELDYLQINRRIISTHYTQINVP